MLKIVLISLALTGLQALPISRRLTKVQDGLPVPVAEGFRQGTEPSRRFIVDLNTGLVQDYISEMDRRTGLLSPSLGKGHGEMGRRHWLTENTVEEIPVQKNGGGWVRVEERAALPDGFRQGTEPSLSIAEGFRQGTEPSSHIPDGFRQGTERFMPIPDGFRQGTEPSLSIPKGFRQGTEPSSRIPDGFRQGTERFMPLPDGFRQGTEPSLSIPKGFRQGTEPSIGIPDGFRQGTERFMPIPDGFRQGTEPSLSIPKGFRQGTEPTDPIVYREAALFLKSRPVNTIPDGFRQGTESSIRIPDGFRQGTERFMPLPDGFRQGTEPSLRIPNGFRQGTEPTDPLDHKDVALSFRGQPSNLIVEGFRPGNGPFMPVRDGEPSNHIQASFSHVNEAPESRQDSSVEGFKPGNGPFMPVRDGEPSNHIQASVSQVNEALESRQEPNTANCDGDIINGRCYMFNPKPMPFLEAQDACKSINQHAELASVTDEDLHSRLVSMVTNGGQRDPVLTWLGGTVKNQRGSWVDGSEWGYSDWMPGQPNIHTDKPVCMEMFRMDETWWTAADCDLERASICSYPVMA